MSSVKRAKHAVYDLKYHFVWVPRHRKLVLQGPVGELGGDFPGHCRALRVGDCPLCQYE